MYVRTVYLPYGYFCMTTKTTHYFSCISMTLSLFQARKQKTREKLAGRKRGKGRERERVIISLNDLFRYTSFWYTLWLGRFDRLYQQSQSGSFLSPRKMACGVHAREIEESTVTSVLNECLRDLPHASWTWREEKMFWQSWRPASVLPDNEATTDQSQEEVIFSL